VHIIEADRRCMRAVAIGNAEAIAENHQRLLALQRRLSTLPRSDAPIVVRAMTELLATLIRSERRSIETRNLLQESARTRAKRYIEHHLHRSRLTPDEIRSAAKVSRASLYRLFEGNGGVAHYVQTRRLERCRQMLEDPRERRLVSEIAYANGFASESHFSRAFRQRYSQTPGELRAGEQAISKRAAKPRAASADGAFDDWIRGFQRGALV
jgi:AraC-like DNA-binding protein